MAGGFSGDAYERLRGLMMGPGMMGQGMPGPAANSPAALQAQYGNAPETVPQWNAMNNFPQAQPAGTGGASPTATPSGPVGGGAPAGGGGGGGDLLSQLRSQILGYDPTAAINAAYDLQTKQGLTDMGMSVEDQLAARGVNTGSATGQDLESRLKGQLLGQLGSARASSLASAQGDRLSRMQQLTELESRQQQQQADNAYRQSQLAMQQREADRAAQNAQAEAAWRQQQETWAREDRTRQDQALAQQQAQQAQQSSSGSAMSGGGADGGMSPEAERARALILGGSGGRTAADLFGGGSDAPTTSSGFAMGGGAGLSGLTDNSGGFGEKTDWHLNKSKPFEGANTSTVGTSQSGSTTTGSGTTVGTGQPFSQAANISRQVAGAGAGALQPKPGAYQPNPRKWGT